jgi:Helix-turn-helix domain
MKSSHRADKKGRGKGTGRFVQLHHYLLESAAWRSLSLSARCAFIEILQVYNGTNNGQLGMAVRYLAERLRCGKTTASRALEELEQKGFIGVQKVGVFGRPMGSEYYVTMHRNDVNFDLPSKAFMHWTEVRTVPSQTSAVPPQVQSQPNYQK